MIAAAHGAPWADEPVSFPALSVRVSRREVLRNLGYPRARRPSARVEQTLDELWDRAHGLLAPRGACRVVSAETARATAMPDLADLPVGLGLCTIGPALESEEQRLSQANQLLEALILDAFGSAAAEAAADGLNAELCRRAQTEGYTLPPRVSPGYGRWDLRGQRELLRLLEHERLGLALTEGLMMVPRKSVSFGVHFERGPQAHRALRHRCAACEMEACAYRVADGENEEGENHES